MVSSSLSLFFSPVLSSQILIEVKGAAALKAVAPFTAIPEVNFFFFFFPCGKGKS